MLEKAFQICVQTMYNTNNVDIKKASNRLNI